MSVLQIVQIAALAIWVAGILFLNLVFGPAVFLMISNRDEAEAAYSNGLVWLHRLGYAAAAIYLVAGVRQNGLVATVLDPLNIVLCVAMVLALVSDFRYLPRKSAIREELGSVSSTPIGDPRRVEFDRLGKMTTSTEITIFALGILLLITALWIPR